MKFDVGVPSGAIKHYVDWVGDGNLHDFAIAAEAAGMDSVNVTDHPFPEDSWLANGGHHAFDPFVALSTMAAVTSTIRLRTNLLVSGYRNPYLMARSIASLDRLSNGRMIAGMGVGYLEAEFGVLEGDYAGRGKRFDETIEAMHAAWTGETVNRPEGFYPAVGHSMLPTPVQQPGPPIWIGGNSKAARRRAAELADGWMPMPTTPVLAEITGTSEITSLDQLAEDIVEVRERHAATGRGGTFEVAFSAFGMPKPADDPDGSGIRAVIAAHADAGIDWVSLGCRGRTLGACIDELAWLGENVVAPYRADASAGAKS